MDICLFFDFGDSADTSHSDPPMRRRFLLAGIVGFFTQWSGNGLISFYRCVRAFIILPALSFLALLSWYNVLMVM